MEPITIGIIAAVAVCGVVALSVFVRQLFLSRNQRVNEEAQNKALSIEAQELVRLRMEVQRSREYDSYYQLLGKNKESIRYIDSRIDEIIENKADLIQRYSQTILENSKKMGDRGHCSDIKKNCGELKQALDKQIAVFDQQLKTLQDRRADLWDTQEDIASKVLNQEDARYKKMDSIYEKHSHILEKMYVKHNDTRQSAMERVIDAGNIAFKQIVLAPFKFLLGFFGKTVNVDPEKVEQETTDREDVQDAQEGLIPREIRVTPGMRHDALLS